MNKKTLSFALLVGLAMSGSALGACDRPEEPPIPDGATASGAEMLQAKKAVEAFLKQAEEYLDCGVATLLQKNMIRQMETVADKFNKELQAYKAKA